MFNCSLLNAHIEKALGHILWHWFQFGVGHNVAVSKTTSTSQIYRSL